MSAKGPMEGAAMAVRPIHHWRDRDCKFLFLQNFLALIGRTARLSLTAMGFKGEKIDAPPFRLRFKARQRPGALLGRRRDFHSRLPGRRITC